MQELGAAAGPGLDLVPVSEHCVVLLMAVPMNWEPFACFPAPNCPLTAIKVSRDLLPGLQTFLRRISLRHQNLSKDYTAKRVESLGMPMEGFLDNSPTLRRA